MEEKKETAKQLTIDNNGRIYQLIVPVDATIGESIDASYALLSRVLEIAQEAAKEIRSKEME